MKLIIDEHYEIHVDSNRNHTLRKNAYTKDGKNVGQHRYDDLGYYRDIPSALKAYLTLEAFDNVKVATLEEYISRYEKAVERLLNDIPAKVSKKR